MGISGMRGSQEMKSGWCLPKSQAGKIKFLLFSHNVLRTMELTGAHHSSPSGWRKFSFLYVRKKKKSLSVLHLETDSCGGPMCAWPLDGSMSTPFPTPLPSFCNQFSVPCLSVSSLKVSARHSSFPFLFAIFTCIQMRGQPAGWECHAVLTEGLQWKNGASWLFRLRCLVTKHQGQYAFSGCCGVWSG